MEQKLKGR